MAWYQYVMAFFGGAFAANFIPHFVQGISGKPFPTPFAKPPGRGLSPPVVNVLWGLANLVVAWLLLTRGGYVAGVPASFTLVFAGFALMGLNLAYFFGQAAKD
jgi:hypothetical protein